MTIGTFFARPKVINNFNQGELNTIKIVNNNTNDEQTFDPSLALDEDSPYTKSSLFTLDRLPLLLLLRKN